MLRLSDVLENRDIMSLRVGATIGYAVSPILNPNNLKIEGWHVTSRDSSDELILPTSYVRELIPKGFVVDDYDALTPVEDLVRMKDVLSYNFQLKGKKVKSDSKRRLGRVTDYVVDDNSMTVMKLHVSPSGITSIAKQDLIIGRNQIIEINDKHIIVKESTIKAGAPMPAVAA